MTPRDTPVRNEPQTEAGRRLSVLLRDIRLALYELAEVAEEPIVTMDDPLPLILAIEAEAASPAALDRTALAAAIQKAGLPMQYLHRIMDEYARLSPSEDQK